MSPLMAPWCHEREGYSFSIKINRIAISIFERIELNILEY